MSYNNPTSGQIKSSISDDKEMMRWFCKSYSQLAKMESGLNINLPTDKFNKWIEENI